MSETKQRYIDQQQEELLGKLEQLSCSILKLKASVNQLDREMTQIFHDIHSYEEERLTNESYHDGIEQARRNQRHRR